LVESFRFGLAVVREIERLNILL